MLKEIKLPELGENIAGGTATKIMVKVGEKIAKEQPIVELETEKAVIEVPCPQEGIVKEILLKENQEIKVGQVMIKLETGGEAPVQETQTTQKPAPETTEETPLPQKPAVVQPEISVQVETQTEKDVPASPAVRRFAREIGIDIVRVPGSGPNGRITEEDVKAFAKAINTSLMQQTAGSPPVKGLPDFARWGEIDRQPVSMVRKKTADNLSYAWNTIPHVTQFDKANITELEELRKRYAKKIEQKGGKLTITPFILKVLTSALKNFPQFNASLNIARNEVIYKKYINIGVAVDTERGLLVPVIKDVDKKSIVELSVELVGLAEKARNKKTTLEEMQGATFTITNLGSIGGEYFTPIVNWPEVAILGVSRAKMEPCFEGTCCQPRLMLPLSLSYDHRLIDGADGARFLKFITEAIKQPFLMELEG